ncbi:MAG TPA: calcium/sodium antiporter [Longimicrobiales bacterium]|nr:calcium/sodium antiporter [Longimicrobiales bacterium]
MTIALLFTAGVILLVSGGEMLVRGSGRLAVSLGVPPLIVGLTVVAFGTSAPELAVSMQAIFTGQSPIAIGNVIGSNIFNVLVVLGLSALIVPLTVSTQLIRLDVPVMVSASVFMYLLASDGRLGPGDGALLATGIVAYTVFQILASRRKGENVEVEEVRGPRNVPLDLALIVGGIVTLILGSRWLVQGAVAVAQALGVSELVIGLTIVAAGTSLPEVVTSVVAALRGQRDIAVGNVVGSNLFNLLCVLGFSALLSPGGMLVAAEAIRFDIPIMLAVSAMCLPIFFGGYRIGRFEGALLFAYYIVYNAYLIMTAEQHHALPAFRIIFGYVLIPASVAFLLISTYHSWQDMRRGSSGAG